VSAADRRLAVHESGHTVVALHYGVAIAHVTLTEVKFRDRDQANVELHALAAITIAGAVAEQKAFGRAILDADDQESLALQLDVSARTDTMPFARAHVGALAAAILTQHWSLVLRVADALVRRRRLDATDVFRLVREEP